MAWGLEARVPFLDKAFLEIAMNIDPAEKMFSKGIQQEVDADGCPKMEKVRLKCLAAFIVHQLISAHIVHPPQVIRLCAGRQG